MTIIATFIAGAYPIVARKLKTFSLDELEIVSSDESSLTAKTTLRPEQLVEFGFFTNVFIVLEGELQGYKRHIKGDSFRLMSLKDGEPTALGEPQKQTLTTQIKSQLGLAQKRGKYVHDFVLIERRNQPQVLTLRLPRPKHKRDSLPGGSLRPELAHILLLVANVKAKDVLLDPFAGHGSILAEAKRGFGLRQTIGFDVQPQNSSPDIRKGDATHLDMPDHSVTKIVTDPPWGDFTPTSPSLYKDALAECARVLVPKGIMVVLSGAQALSDLLAAHPSFTVLKSFTVLVSGKKATVHKLQKQ